MSDRERFYYQQGRAAWGRSTTPYGEMTEHEYHYYLKGKADAQREHGQQSFGSGLGGRGLGFGAVDGIKKVLQSVSFILLP